MLIVLLGQLWRPHARAQVNELICPYHEPGRGCRIPTPLRSPVCLAFVEQEDPELKKLNLAGTESLAKELLSMLERVLHGPRLDGRFDPAENEAFIQQSLGIVDLLIQQIRQFPPFEQAKQ